MPLHGLEFKAVELLFEKEKTTDTQLKKWLKKKAVILRSKYKDITIFISCWLTLAFYIAIFFEG